MRGLYRSRRNTPGTRSSNIPQALGEALLAPALAHSVAADPANRSRHEPLPNSAEELGVAREHEHSDTDQHGGRRDADIPEIRPSSVLAIIEDALVLCALPIRGDDAMPDQQTTRSSCSTGRGVRHAGSGGKARIAPSRRSTSRPVAQGVITVGGSPAMKPSSAIAALGGSEGRHQSPPHNVPKADPPPIAPPPNSP